MDAPFWVNYALAMSGGLSGLQFAVGVGSFLALVVLSTFMLIFLPMKPANIKRFFTGAERKASVSSQEWKRDMVAHHSH